jgi:hypothetical protein
MKTFAEIDSNNIVTNVIQAPDDATAESLKQNDQLITGVKFVESKNDGSLRVRAPQIGGIYNEAEDRFEHLQPYPSWTQTANGAWEAPVAKPTAEQSADRHGVQWNEDLQKWVSPKKSEVDALAEGEVAPNYYFDNATNTWVVIE